MLTPYKITDYCKEYQPEWTCIIALVLNPTDGVVRQTGAHRSHYTWWRTRKFQMSNLTMLKI